MLTCAIQLSCKEPEITFAEPQPFGVDKKIRLHERYLGKYENPEIGSVLEIGRELIINRNLFQASMKISEGDSMPLLKGNVLTDLKTKDSVVVKTQKDSISWDVETSDTVNAIFDSKKNARARISPDLTNLKDPRRSRIVSKE